MSAALPIGPGAIACVALGSAAGAVCRYELARRIIDRVGDAFPWGTAAVNVLGCLLAGILLGAALLPSPSWPHLLLVAGFLGSFTTVSSFGLESVLLIRRGRRAGALVYSFGSIVACVAAVAAGFSAARWLVV